MKTIHKHLLVAATAAGFALPGTALAGGQLYLISNAPPFWQDSDFDVPYNLNPGTAAGNVQGANPEQQFIDAVNAAFQTWEDVPTAKITFAQGPDSADLLDNSANDGVNLMVFHDRAIVQGIQIPLPAGVLGVTNSVFNQLTGVMTGGAITLNTNPLPDEPAPHYSTSGAPNTLDVQAIMVHEAGHFIGMSHSAVRNDGNGDLVGGPSNASIMFPFLGPDALDGRTADPDDVAWVSFIYPSASYATTFGQISGTVPYGQGAGGCGGNEGAHGAHVVARDVGDLVGGEPRMIVGTYAYKQDGDGSPWTIPGLPPGTYEIWIEPLDGSPVDALQVNSRIQFGSDKNFPEDWYSGGAESGNEGDPNNPATAVPVTVIVGSTTSGIEILVDDSSKRLDAGAILLAPVMIAAGSRIRRRRSAA